MFTRRFIVLGLLSTITVLGANRLEAADPYFATISVQGMHCAGCAAKVTRKLQAVAGVEKAQVNAVEGTAIVSAKADAAPSPRDLWEAIEKAGYKPTRLVGPTGTFTVKPKS